MPDRALPNLPSRDLAITQAFYATFGFTEHYCDAGWLILRRGSVQIEFFTHPDLDPLTSSFRCTVRVADLDEWWHWIRAAGVPVRDTGHPRLHEPRIEASGLRIGHLIDPDGTLVTLIEDPSCPRVGPPAVGGRSLPD